MLKKNSFTRFFNQCVLVKGIKASCIIDFQRCQLIEISTFFAEILDYSCKNSLANTFQEFHEVPENQITQVLQDLERRELIFFTSTPSNFPTQANIWKRPNTITNAIIEVQSSSTFRVVEVLRDLIGLGCSAIQIRFLPNNKKIPWEDLLAEIQESSLKVLELIVKYDALPSLEELQIAVQFEGRLKILVYEVPEHQITSFNSSTDQITAFRGKLSKVQIDIQTICTTSFEFYLEALSYNVALNRKVCISAAGEIKNYLSHIRSFGNISQVKIQDIISLTDFQDLWHINNDRIYKCRDCQFRYSCFWNVGIIQKNGDYHKLKNCKFDPYSNTWNKT